MQATPAQVLPTPKKQSTIAFEPLRTPSAVKPITTKPISVEKSKIQAELRQFFGPAKAKKRTLKPAKARAKDHVPPVGSAAKSKQPPRSAPIKAISPKSDASTPYEVVDLQANHILRMLANQTPLSEVKKPAAPKKAEVPFGHVCQPIKGSCRSKSKASLISKRSKRIQKKKKLTNPRSVDRHKHKCCRYCLEPMLTNKLKRHVVRYHCPADQLPKVLCHQEGCELPPESDWWTRDPNPWLKDPSKPKSKSDYTFARRKMLKEKISKGCQERAQKRKKTLQKKRTLSSKQSNLRSKAQQKTQTKQNLYSTLERIKKFDSMFDELDRSVEFHWPDLQLQPDSVATKQYYKNQKNLVAETESFAVKEINELRHHVGPYLKELRWYFQTVKKVGKLSVLLPAGGWGRLYKEWLHEHFEVCQLQDLTFEFTERWDSEQPNQPRASCSNLKKYRPQGSQSFQLIFCNWSFEYLEYGDAVDTIERLSWHLEEDGLLIVKGNKEPDSHFEAGKDERLEPTTGQLVRKVWLHKQLGLKGHYKQYKQLCFAVCRQRAEQQVHIFRMGKKPSSGKAKSGAVKEE